MKKILLILSLCVFLQAQSPAVGLKPRQPNWRADAAQMYPQGLPQLVVFYEPQLNGSETPVKQIVFFENGQIQSEMDVVLVEENAPVAQEWKSLIVPHGVRVDFTNQGAISRVSHYQAGVLEGVCTFFYPNGKVNAEMRYQKGLLEGALTAFHEDGSKQEEAMYVHGALQGDVNRYFVGGVKS